MHLICHACVKILSISFSILTFNNITFLNSIDLLFTIPSYFCRNEITNKTAKQELQKYITCIIFLGEISAFLLQTYSQNS